MAEFTDHINWQTLLQLAEAFAAYTDEIGPEGVIAKLQSGEALNWVEFQAIVSWLGLPIDVLVKRERVGKTLERWQRLVEIYCSQEDMQRRINARFITGPMTVTWSDGSKSILDANGSHDLFEY